MPAVGGNLLKQPYMLDVPYRTHGQIKNTDIVMANTFWIRSIRDGEKELIIWSRRLMTLFPNFPCLDHENNCLAAHLDFFLGIFIHALVYIIPANTDLVDGTFLHMDERITFDQTYEIVSSASPKALITNFVANDSIWAPYICLQRPWLPFSFLAIRDSNRQPHFLLLVVLRELFRFFFAGINF